MTAVAERLRPMSDAEQSAVAMWDDGVEIADIASRTGLTRPQIATAVELRDKFNQILSSDSDAAPTPPAPAPAPLKAAPKAAAPKPAKPATSAKSAEGIEDVLAAAEVSPQPRARELAAEVRQILATLKQMLANDEKYRMLSAARDVLAKQLAETEAELAALLGAVPAPARIEEPATAPIADDVPAPDASPEERKRLSYSPVVRAWAQADGWDVDAHGRMSGAIVTAYLKANPEAARP
jgi:hypothetical protein